MLFLGRETAMSVHKSKALTRLGSLSRNCGLIFRQQCRGQAQPLPDFASQGVGGRRSALKAGGGVGSGDLKGCPRPKASCGPEDPEPIPAQAVTAPRRIDADQETSHIA